MDDLKKYLKQLQRHHFWILCGLIAVAFLGAWYTATQRVKTATSANASAITGDYQKARSVQGVVNHPNEESAKGMQQLIENTGIEVYKAWRDRYKQQESILVWPEELTEEFRNKVQDLKPIEQKVDFPESQDQLGLLLRSQYMNYIKAELPRLAQIIGARWEPMAGSRSSGFPGSGGTGTSGSESSYAGSRPTPSTPDAPDDLTPIVVEWSTANQQSLQSSRFDWAGNPTTLEILYAQEDLWALTALMMIIKATNHDADAPYNAAIKEIEAIDLGHDTRGIKEVGKIGEATSTVTSRGGGYGGMPGGIYGARGGGGSSGSGRSQAAPNYATGANSGRVGGSGARAADPGDGRYVNDKYEPLTASQLRSAFGSSPSESDAFLVVAKRMPVRIRVKMDVLKLPLLLAECGNSRLPVEIRQVRINTPSGANASAGGAMGRGMGGGRGGAGTHSPKAAGTGQGGGAAQQTLNAGDMGGGEGPGGGTGLRGGGGYPGVRGGAAVEEIKSPYEAEVELYGIIYLYNPPNKKALGLDDAAVASDRQSPAAPNIAGGQAGG